MKFAIIIIFFVILTSMKVYVYCSFLRHSVMFRHCKWLAIGLLTLVAIGELSMFVVRDRHFSPTQYILVGLCVVVDYTLFVSCVIGDIIKFITRITRRYISKKQDENKLTNPDRRRFLSILADLGIMALFVFLSIKAVRSAISIPPVKHIKITLPKLMLPKKIALITDVHIGKTLGGAFLSEVVAKINTLEADIVVIVGDLVDEKIALIKDDLLVLNDLKSKEGVYYVAGNHEYYHGIREILAFISTLNITILHNRHIELSGFNLAGVSDLAGERFKFLPPDLDSAKNGLNPQKPSILLAHQPLFVRRNDVSDFSLVLCGHTHAGQVFPLSIFVWLQQHYIYGLYRLSQNTQLYVSSGVGFWGPAIRFLAPSEIVCIELESAN